MVKYQTGEIDRVAALRTFSSQHLDELQFSLYSSPFLGRVTLVNRILTLQRTKECLFASEFSAANFAVRPILHNCTIP